jgi:tetratricopeptide (TPR) repeat protein
MSRAKLIFVPIVVAILIGSSYLVGWWQGDARPLAQPSPSQPDTDTSIAFWQKRIAANPKAYIDYTLLGQAFARKARETGDVGYFQRSEAALRQALGINPTYVPASAQLSSTLFAMHDFKGALAIAEPLAGHPKATQALATIGDAHMALGDYAEAEAATQKLFEQEGPNPAIYSRQAALAELRGETDRALALLEQATDLARRSGDYGENLAWYEYQLGELYFKNNQLDRAVAHYQAALDEFDNYYLGLAGMGKVRAAQGDYRAAIELYQHAVTIVPQPEFLAALGDIYMANGQPDKAKQQYDTVEYIGKLAKINQQIYNRQLANFYSDHDLHLDEALKLATDELAVRKDVFGFDAAAWAYYKNGRLSQAQDAIEQALRFGTRDAKLYYHAGMIAQARGHAADAQRLLAQALAINPHFDLLQSRIARATLDQIARNN